MDFIPSPNTVRVEMIYASNGQHVENVLNYTHTGTLTEENMFHLGDNCADRYNTTFKLHQHNACALIAVKVTQLDAQDAPAIVWNSFPPIAGLAPGNTTPNNVTCAIQLHTAKRGRSYNGRLFHCGMPEVAYRGNDMYGPEMILLQAAYEAWMSFAVDGITFTLVVLSRFHLKAPRAVAVCTPVQSISVSPHVDSQRRRLTGRGT